MLHISSLFVLYHLNNFCFGQTNKEREFGSAVQQVVLAISSQDSTAVSKFIKKGIGTYQLYRSGVFDNFKYCTTLSFSNKAFPAILISDSKGIKLMSLKYSSLPTYDCDKERWSKSGLFVDTTKISHLLSGICKDRNKNVPDSISRQKIKYFFDLENKSRRIVLCDINHKELVFYLSYINNHWFLTIIDNVTSDCSA